MVRWPLPRDVYWCGCQSPLHYACYLLAATAVFLDSKKSGFTLPLLPSLSFREARSFKGHGSFEDAFLSSQNYREDLNVHGADFRTTGLALRWRLSLDLDGSEVLWIFPYKGGVLGVRRTPFRLGIGSTQILSYDKRRLNCCISYCLDAFFVCCCRHDADHDPSNS